MLLNNLSTSEYIVKLRCKGQFVKEMLMQR